MDLREFIDRLGKDGHLKRVERQVDWQFELGEITRTTRIPLLFENIKDYPGQRVFVNGMSGISSMGIALGLGPVRRWRTLITAVRQKVKQPIKPRAVINGPVLQNVLAGPQIDFLQFAIPRWSKEDGGRYLGTWHINVSKDVKTGARNVGVYRMEVLGPNLASISTSPNSHLGRHMASAEKAGKPLEMAVAIGVGEALIMAAAAGIPYGADEYELAGSLQERSVELVKCATVDLEVPADAEIAIEGIVKPGVRVSDGPYFDYVGASNTNPQAFLFEAKRLMFRNNPIFRGTAVGMAGAEDQQIFAVLARLGLFDFHGSRAKHLLQAELLKRRLFRMFQLVGSIGWKTLTGGKRAPTRPSLPAASYPMKPAKS